MPPQFPDTQIGDANTAAAEHQLYRSLRGYGWVSGSAATPVSNATQVGVDDTASVWIDSTEVDVSSTGNIADIQPHGDYPRWATIVVEDDGNVTAVMGEVNKPVELDDGTRVTGRQAPRPQPPVITDPTKCVYAFVWVPKNASEIQSEHIVDRRIDARVDAYNFTLNQYSDADAIAAAESEDPFDHAGAVNIGGELTTTGAGVFEDDVQLARNIQLLSGATNPLALQTFDSNGALVDRVRIDTGDDDEELYFDDVRLFQVSVGDDAAIFRLNAAQDDDSLVKLAPNDGTETWQVRGHSDTSDTFSIREMTSGDNRRIIEATSSSVNVHSAASFTHAGDDVVVSSDSGYDIQKNGTDGTGVINFKT